MLKKIDYIMLSVLAGMLVVSGYVQVSALNDGTPAAVIATELSSVVADEVQTQAEAEDERVSALPDFAAITDVRQKKRAFFNYMEPLVEQENRRLTGLRNQVQLIQEQARISEAQQQWLQDLARNYRVDSNGQFDQAFFQELLTRVDIIPVSLALAQAANESAWGTSRFAVEGNNLFGQWCFSKGCGIVPSGRPEGARYEVKKFASVAESVQAYIHNLNTHPQYQEMRQLRRVKRERLEPLTGRTLAEGLYAYSIRGEAYIDELVMMIDKNNLLKYDLDAQEPNT